MLSETSSLNLQRLTCHLLDGARTNKPSNHEIPGQHQLLIYTARCCLGPFSQKCSAKHLGLRGVTLVNSEEPFAAVYFIITL